MDAADWVILLLPGLVISGLGSLMMWSHYRTRVSQSGEIRDAFEESHLARRFRRRMQASGLLVVLGILISGGQLIDGREMPALFGIYWLFVLFLTFWVILLALGDAASILSYSKLSQGKLNQQRREIEREFERLKARQGNGHPRSQQSEKESRDSPNSE